MKKIVTFGLVATVGATMALASSISVPWFVDNAPAGAGVPPVSGVMGLIFLHNNTAFDKTCDITYYSEVGVQLVPTINTFVVPANSSIAFRPVREDPSPVTTVGINGPITPFPLGQEGPAGVLVPDRPSPDGKKNGSCVISWTGGTAKDIQGQYTQYTTYKPSDDAARTVNKLGNTVPLTLSTAHTLPEGS